MRTLLGAMVVLLGLWSLTPVRAQEPVIEVYKSPT